MTEEYRMHWIKQHRANIADAEEKLKGYHDRLRLSKKDGEKDEIYSHVSTWNCMLRNYRDQLEDLRRWVVVCEKEHVKIEADHIHFESNDWNSSLPAIRFTDDATGDRVIGEFYFYQGWYKA